MHAVSPSPPPLDSLHLRFAYELIREEGGLSQRVMHELVAGPRPFAELKILGAGKPESELAGALRHLEGCGFIARRTSKRQVPIVHTYELTIVGGFAERTMQRLRPMHDTPRALSKRQKSDLALARRVSARWMLEAR